MVENENCRDKDGFCETVSDDDSDGIEDNEARDDTDCASDAVMSPVCEGKYCETVAREVCDGSIGDSVADDSEEKDTLEPEDSE